MKNNIEQYINQNILVETTSFQENNLLNNNSNIEYTKNNIFHAILDFIISENNSLNKMDYLTLFYTYEKLLDHARMRDYNICEYYVDKINFLHKEVEFDSNLSFQGMNSLYNPAIGYYYYSIKDFDQSIQHMLSSIQNINELINYGFHDATFIKIEQYLNIFRLYYDFQLSNEAVQYAINVINYILGEVNYHFEEYPIEKVIRNENQYNEIIIIFFNAIIFKILRNYSDVNDIFKDNTLRIFFSCLFYSDEKSKNYIFEAIDLLKNIFERDLDSECFCQIICNKEVLFNTKVPSSIRFILFKFILNKMNFSETTKEVISKYEDDILLKNEKNRILFVKNNHKNLV